MITGLTHVALKVGDIEESIRFYCDTLGLSEKFRLKNEKGDPILVYIQVATSVILRYPNPVG